MVILFAQIALRLLLFFNCSLKAILYVSSWLILFDFILCICVFIIVASVYAANVNPWISPLLHSQLNRNVTFTCRVWSISEEHQILFYSHERFGLSIFTLVRVKQSGCTLQTLWLYCICHTEFGPRCLCFIERVMNPPCWAERGSSRLIIDTSLMVRNQKTSSLCCASTTTAAVFPLMYCCCFL